MFDRLARLSLSTPCALSLLSAALLAACGGGGDSGSAEPLSNNDATSYAANASVVGSDATGALDTTLLTATQLVPGSVGAAGVVNGREQAQAVSTGALTCAGGGTATLSIDGPTPANWINGRLDADEVYQITYNQCRGAAGQAALNGDVTMTVLSASSNSAGSATSVNFSTTNLTAVLPRGTASFNGNVAVQRTVTVVGNTSSVSTHVTSTSFVVTTNFNNRTSVFTLGNVDLTRQASFAGSVLQSTSHTGSHTLSAVLPNLRYSYSVATQGGTVFDANGLPTQGGWVITLPRRTVTITVAGSNATIAIDDGNNGSIDRSFTVPIAALAAGAG